MLAGVVHALGYGTGGHEFDESARGGFNSCGSCNRLRELAHRHEVLI